GWQRRMIDFGVEQTGKRLPKDLSVCAWEEFDCRLPGVTIEANSASEWQRGRYIGRMGAQTTPRPSNAQPKANASRLEHSSTRLAAVRVRNPSETKS
uniref:hypothetical protein n=1 Tax=Escherichia coli TaxID=562 RepID=UPI002FCA11C9